MFGAEVSELGEDIGDVLQLFGILPVERGWGSGREEMLFKGNKRGGHYERKGCLGWCGFIGMVISAEVCGVGEVYSPAELKG